MFVDSADESKRIARGFEIDRRSPRLNQCPVVVGLMVITVEQHQIAACQQRIGHHFIGSGRSVKDKVSFIGVEHFRRELLRVFGGTFMNQ
ncbi:hypothetical protein D3C71_1330490 [compost metagenome]